MNRRTLLTTATAGIATTLAGCGGSDGGERTETRTASPTGTPTATATETPTETESAEPTDTPTAEEYIERGRGRLDLAFSMLHEADIYDPERRHHQVQYDSLAAFDPAPVRDHLTAAEELIRAAGDTLDEDASEQRYVAAQESARRIGVAATELLPELATTYLAMMDANHQRQRGNYERALSALEPAYDSVDRWSEPASELADAVSRLRETKAPPVPAFTPRRWIILSRAVNEFQTAEAMVALSRGLAEETSAVRAVERGRTAYRNGEYETAKDRFRAAMDGFDAGKAQSDGTAEYEYSVGLTYTLALSCVGKERSEATSILFDACLKQLNGEASTASDWFALGNEEYAAAGGECTEFPDGRSFG